MIVFGYLIAAGIAAASFYAYVTYVSGLGFPDGFISELAYAERSLAAVFIASGLATSCAFVYLRHRHRARPGRTAFTVIAISYAAALAGIAVADTILRERLMGSGGG